MRIFSFGGGVQSTAVLVLATQGAWAVAYDAYVFANVGEDSENPDTLAYIENYTKPFAKDHGLNFVEVRRIGRDKQVKTLYKEIHRQQKSIIIPLRMSGNGALGNRNCTVDFKIKVVDRWARQQGATSLTVGLGISLDEFGRMRDIQPHPENGLIKTREYPLIDLRLTRQDCFNLIHAVGLPVPPKSSCWFCPFKRKNEWIEMKRKQPDLFAKAVDLEQACNQKRTALKRDALYMHPSLKPLDQAVGDQLSLFPDVEDGCDSGYCMT